MDLGYVYVPKEAFLELVKKVEDLDSLVETLEILSDKEILESIKRSEKEISEGKLKKLENLDELDKGD